MEKRVAIFFLIFLLVIPLSFAVNTTNNLQYNLNASKVNLTYDLLNRIIQKNTTTTLLSQQP